jgi:hypothetical protein
LDLVEVVCVAEFCNSKFAFNRDEGAVECFAALTERLGYKGLGMLAFEFVQRT